MDSPNGFSQLVIDIRIWLVNTFGLQSEAAKQTRVYPFLEEAVELAQAAGLPKAIAMRIVDRVYDQPTATVDEEVGDVLLTLIALATAHQVDLVHAGQRSLAKGYMKQDAIRKKAARLKILPEPEPKPQRVPNPEFTAWFDQQQCGRCGYTPDDCTCPGACIDKSKGPSEFLE